MTMHPAQQMQHVQQMSTCCELCSEGHTSDICPVNPESIYYMGQQASGPMNQHAQYGKTYNPNWRNHPNFSWGGNQKIRPQANYNHPPQPPQQAEESLTDVMKRHLIDNQKVMTENQQFRAENQQLRTEFRNLERQFGQMANNQNTRPAGALSSYIEHNPKAQVNGVTLRNGRELEEVSEKKKYTTSPEGKLILKPVEENEKENKGSEPINMTRPPPPFPQRLQKQKYDDYEVPKYTRYLRDIVANKRRHTEFETVALTKECSARFQSKLPPKLKDPGCFTIPLSLGKQEVSRALCDLGAGINLMPSSLFKQLGLGVLRPATITLQLDDKSLADEEVPIILGRPFLATGGALIDVREGKLKMRVVDEEITFNVYKGREQSPYMNCSDLDGTIELEKVVLQAGCVRMIEKRARDERGDLLRACKKAILDGRKKRRKHLA
ncbi:PREDICTED: uncharacterized protein LOC109244059 [Nicotiana attenuata]|uniref:uncharacterized protein LOC109244059 n=1 Tax=Nicotiana attenuata TaxID=49451 RepID=UPI00090583E0|nr:PREDICTED: uncharacterized protein LOC109244059 [Nicotiana attenuata]